MWQHHAHLFCGLILTWLLGINHVTLHYIRCDILSLLAFKLILKNTPVRNMIWSYQSKLATRPGSYRGILLEVIRPKSKRKKGSFQHTHQSLCLEEFR